MNRENYSGFNVFSAFFTTFVTICLQENPSEKDMNQGTLVIFNVDTTVSNDELLKLFGAHGEIREVTFCFACGFKCANQTIYLLILDL